MDTDTPPLLMLATTPPKEDAGSAPAGHAPRKGVRLVQNGHTWGSLIADALKEAGTKGMTSKEICAWIVGRFPDFLVEDGRSRHAVQQALSHHKKRFCRIDEKGGRKSFRWTLTDNYNDDVARCSTWTRNRCKRTSQMLLNVAQKTDPAAIQVPLSSSSSTEPTDDSSSPSSRASPASSGPALSFHDVASQTDVIPDISHHPLVKIGGVPFILIPWVGGVVENGAVEQANVFQLEQEQTNVFQMDQEQANVFQMEQEQSGLFHMHQ